MTVEASIPLRIFSLLLPDPPLPPDSSSLLLLILISYCQFALRLRSTRNRVPRPT